MSGTLPVADLLSRDSLRLVAPEERAHLIDVLVFNSGGSRQGYTVDVAFGASAATSTEVWYECAGVSSGRTSMGVRHERTKSRETLYTKSGLRR